MTELEYTLSQLGKLQPTVDTPQVSSFGNSHLLNTVLNQPQQEQFSVQDGDTVNNWRIHGFDTPESYAESAKAKKLADEYGVPIEDQIRLGLAAKEETSRLLQDPNNQKFSPTSDLIDDYGRLIMGNDQLKEKLIGGGFATPMDRYDQKAQALYRSAMEKKRALGYGKDADYMDQIRESNTNYKEQGFFDSVGKSADAFQSGTVQALGKLGDFITDIGAWGAEKVGADNAAKYLDKIGETWANSEYADKLTGYDRQEAQYRQQEALYEFKQGNYTGAFMHALNAAPEMVAESLPLMFEMIMGGGKAKAAAKGFNAIKGAMKRNAGFAAVVGQETNAQAEEFEQVNGYKPDGLDLARMAGVNTLMFGLDRLAFKEITGLAGDFKNIADKLSLNDKKTILGKVLAGTAKTAGATVAEGGQEYLQTWGEILNINAKTIGDYQDVFKEGKFQDEAIIGGIMGAAGGTTMHVGSRPLEGAMTMAAGLKDEHTQLVQEQQVQKETKAADIPLTQEQKDVVEEYSPKAHDIIRDALKENTPIEEIEASLTEKLSQKLASMADSGDVKFKHEDIPYIVKGMIQNAQDPISGFASPINRMIQEQDIPVAITSNDTTVDYKGTKDSRHALMSDDQLHALATEGFESMSTENFAKNSQDSKIFERMKNNFKSVGMNWSGHFKPMVDKLTKDIDSAKATLGKVIDFDNDKNAKAQVVRLSAIAMDNIVSAISSTQHEADNAGLEIDKEVGAAGTIYTQIGKDYLNSYGKSLKGTAKDNNRVYMEIGKAAVAHLEAQGFVQSDARTVLPIGKDVTTAEGHRFHTKMPKTHVPKNMELDTTQPGKVGMISKGVKITDSLKDIQGKLSGEANSLIQLARVLNPGNLETPHQDGGEVSVDNNRAINKTQKKIVEQLAELEYQIKPEFIQFLKSVKDRVAHYKSYDQAVNEDPLLQNILHTKYKVLDYLEDSNTGFNRSRRDKLRDILDNLDLLTDEKELGNKFNFDYKVAVNQRIHVMQTVLDFQGDKWLSRQILTGGEYTTGSQAEAEILINYAIEESSLDITREQVLGDKLSKYERELRILDEAKELDIKTINKILNGKTMKNPFEFINDLKLVLDIRKSEDLTKITTSYMPGFDATASGVVNTLLNLSGDPRVQKMLKKLRIKFDKDGEYGNMDPYKLLSTFIADPDKMAGELGIETVFEYDAELIERISELTDHGIFKNDRDLAKSPVMTSFYGQAGYNTEVSMAENITEKLIENAIYSENNEYSLAKIHAITGKKDLTKLTKTDVDKITAYYQENLTSKYVKAFDSLFKPVLEYREKINDLFAVLKGSGEWDGTVPSAFQAHVGDNNPDHNMSVKKNKTEIIEVDGEGIPSTTTNPQFNQTSLGVNLQHGQDASQLLIALMNAMSKGDKDGIMTIHDNIMAKPSTLLKAKPAYEKSIIDSATEYDYIDNIIKVAEKLAKTDAHKKVVAELKAKNEEMMKAKAEFLKEAQSDLFGLKNMDEVINRTEVKSAQGVQQTLDNLAEERRGKVKSALINLREGVRLGNRETIIESLQSLGSISKLDETYQGLLDKAVNFFKGERIGFFIDPNVEELYTVANKINVAGLGKIKDARIDKDFDIKSIIEALAHEVDHAVHNSYIQQNFNSKEVQFLVKRVLPALENLDLSKIQEKSVRDRIKYLLPETQNVLLSMRTGKADPDQVQMQAVKEFIAIIRNEPRYARKILKHMFPEESKRRSIVDMLKKFFSDANNWFKKNADFFKNKPLDEIDLSLKNTIHAIELVQFKAEMADVIETDFTVTRLAKTMPVTDKIIDMTRMAGRPVDYVANGVNEYVRTMIGTTAGVVADAASPYYRKAYKKAYKNSPVFRQTMNLLMTGFSDTSFAHRMKVSLGLKDNYDKSVVNKLAQLGTEIIQSTKTLLTNHLSSLDERLKQNFSTEEITQLDAIFGRTGYAHLIDTMYDDTQSYAAAILNETITLDDAIKAEEAKFSPSEIIAVDKMVDYYINGKVSGVMANFDNLSGVDKLRGLLALKSLKATKGIDTLLKAFKSHPEVYNELMQLSVSVREQMHVINRREVHEGIGSVTTSGSIYNDYDGFGTMDVYDTNYEFVVVSEADMRTSKYSADNGYTVIRQPVKGKYGVVARESFSNGFSHGLGLGTNRFMNGIVIPKDKAWIFDKERDHTKLISNNALKTNDGQYRLILTAAEKSKLDLKKNPAHTLYRTFAHNKEVIEADAVREMVLDTVTSTMDRTDINTLARAIKANGEATTNMPLFITMKDDFSYDSLPEHIKKYYKTPQHITTYGGFNEKIHLVRKDMAHILLGYPNVQIFNSDAPYALKRAEDIFRKLIAMLKMKLVVANPLKLAMDAVSNFSYLVTMGVSLADIYKYSKEGMDAYHGLSRLRGELINSKLQYAVSKDPRDEKKIRRLEAAIKNNKFYTAYQHGFVQSYSTDLITKDFDTISGLQSDMDKIINKLITDEKDNLNNIGKVIEWWSNFGASKGFTLDALLSNASRLAKLNGTKIGDEMQGIADRLAKHRNEKNLDRYLGEILASPSSELVKVGSSIMTTTDAISKYIYANHLQEQVNRKTGALHTEEEAYQEANDSFIDYRLNMPPEIKALSDFGLLMFPGYWMRIQRIIYLMFKKKPVNAIIAATGAEISGLQGSNIIDSNIVEKAMNGNLLQVTNPFELGTLFPFLK